MSDKREKWIVRQRIRDEEMHRHPNGGYAIYEGNRAVTGWGSVTQSKEDAELICNAVNGYDAGRSAREWRRVESAEDLPKEGKWWVTYQDFYGKRETWEGVPADSGNWQLGGGMTVAREYIKAVMPYFKPEPYQEAK